MENELENSEFENKRIFHRLVESEENVTKTYNKSFILLETISSKYDELLAQQEKHAAIDQSMNALTSENKNLVSELNIMLKSNEKVLEEYTTEDNKILKELGYTRSRVCF